MGEAKRVIIIADYAIAEGGAPMVAIASALGLAALGHEVTYIHGVGEGDARFDAYPGIKRIGLDGQDVWNKSMLAGARDGVWNAAHQARLAKILAGFDPSDTVVHVHQWTKFFSPSVFSVVRKSGLPLVVSLHDYFISCPTGLMYRFDRKEHCACRPLSFACLTAPCDPRSSLHKTIRVLRALMTNQALKNFPFTALHVSETGRKTIGHFLPAHVRQVVLDNPIECEDRGPRAARSNLKVAYCGRLTEEKGADLVALAAQKLGLPCLFIGEGPLRERIQAIAPDAKITGWLDKAATREMVEREALAVIAPSRWPETGPLVVAEAMASGVPVIVSDRAGASQQVEHGATGFVVAPDAESIARVITELRRPGMAETMGRNAYGSFWADPQTTEVHARKLASLYASVPVIQS